MNSKVGRPLLEAIRKEAEAHAFYREAALLVRNPLARRRLLGLAEDEAQHEATLSRLYWSQTGREPGEIPAAPPRAGAELASLDMADVLRLAVGEEEKASANYARMAKESGDARVRAFLEYLVDIENGHAEALRQELKLLEKSPGWHVLSDTVER